MTVAEARDAVVRSPDFWKVALLEGTAFPLLDQIDTEVRLFELKREAGDAFKTREQELLEQGYKRTSGARSRGLVILGRGDELVGLGLDYVGRV